MGFAAAADHGERGTALEPAKLLVELDAQALDELRLLGWVEAGQHAVLPDQDSQFVADVPEHTVFVGDIATDPHHVHAGLDDQPE